MNELLTQTQFLHIPLLRWIYAVALAAVTYLLIVNGISLVARRLRRLEQGHQAHWLHMVNAVLQGTKRWLILLLSLLIGAKVLALPASPQALLDHIAFLIAGLQIGIWLSRAINAWSQGRLQQQASEASNPVIMAMMSWAIRVLVWATLVLAVLANMGVNITAFVASLGIGGVAVALALQSLLGDLFASVAIGLDKPFQVGEFVVFGDIAGTIRHVGIKTTRIGALSGEEVVLSNSALLGKTIHNYARMERRRIVFSFGVAYDTSPEQLRAIPGLVAEAVKQAGNAVLDRAHFLKFGDSSLDFEVVYIVQNADYNVYMDIQQYINLYLLEQFNARHISIPFPNRTLSLDNATRELALQWSKSKIEAAEPA